MVLRGVNLTPTGISGGYVKLKPYVESPILTETGSRGFLGLLLDNERFTNKFNAISTLL